MILESQWIVLMISILIYCKIIFKSTIVVRRCLCHIVMSSEVLELHISFQNNLSCHLYDENRHRRSWIKLFVEFVIEFVALQIYHLDVLFLRCFSLSDIWWSTTLRNDRWDHIRFICTCTCSSVFVRIRDYDRFHGRSNCFSFFSRETVSVAISLQYHCQYYFVIDVDNDIAYRGRTLLAYLIAPWLSMFTSV